MFIRPLWLQPFHPYSPNKIKVLGPFSKYSYLSNLSGLQKKSLFDYQKNISKADYLKLHFLPVLVKLAQKVKNRYKTRKFHLLF